MVRRFHPSHFSSFKPFFGLIQLVAYCNLGMWPLFLHFGRDLTLA